MSDRVKWDEEVYIADSTPIPITRQEEGWDDGLLAKLIGPCGPMPEEAPEVGGVYAIDILHPNCAFKVTTYIVASRTEQAADKAQRIWPDSKLLHVYKCGPEWRVGGPSR